LPIYLDFIFLKLLNLLQILVLLQASITSSVVMIVWMWNKRTK